MKLEPLPKRLFERNIPVTKPLFKLKRGRGQSKISAILAIAALILATTLTVLLIKHTVS
jgi:hypothetical protein